MTQLTVTEVLLAYEEPLVVLATDGKSNKSYVGMNYGDGEASHLFYFAKVSAKNFELLLEQRIDVRYLITKHRIGEFLTGEVWGEIGNTLKAKSDNKFSHEYLPDTGMFIPSQALNTNAVQVKTVNIDGRWGIDDLSRFSDLVQDAYAFVYALSGAGEGSTKQRMGGLFSKYPWRGGFSSVNFFDDLYRLIPAQERAQIQKIQYASPGKIELRMSNTVAAKIRHFVADINNESSAGTLAYTEVRAHLKLRGWLGKALQDLELTDQDKAMLLGFVGKLCGAFGLASQADEIVSFAGSDPLGAVKILLAYYRRLAGLADYVATGKAQELFV